MNRRRLVGMVAALALAAFTGASVGATEPQARAKSSCVCCGASCVCADCSCDLNAKAGQACECCENAACCSVKPSTGKAQTSGQTSAASTKVTACACCEAGCVCAACLCDVNAKAGQACECCGEAACCSVKSSKTQARDEKAAQPKVKACCSSKAGKAVAPATR